mgnify:CR=1 FL=1
MRGQRNFSSRFFLARNLRWGVLFTLVLLVAFSTGWLSPAAPLEGPGKHDRQVVIIVRKLMKDAHLSRHPLDDEISGRAMKIFTEGFDGRKLYFLRSDIDEFMKDRNEIDDFVKKGDLSFAYKVFDRFITRLDQRVATVERLVPDLFGGHVTSRSGNRFCSPTAEEFPQPFSSFDGQRKVNQLAIPFIINEKVVGFYITMYPTLVMQVLKPFKYIANHG